MVHAELEGPQLSREVVDSSDPRGLALELLQCMTPALPEPIAEVVSALIAGGRLVEALGRAEAAINALRRARMQLPLTQEAPMVVHRAPGTKPPFLAQGT